MYYILNGTNQIIAADTDLLKVCGLADIDALTLSIALGETKFQLNGTRLVISTHNDERTYTVSTRALSSMLGHIMLVEIQASQEKVLAEDHPDDNFEDSFKEIDLEENLFVEKTEETDSSISIHETEETEIPLHSFDLDDEPFIVDTKPEEDSIPEITQADDDDLILFDLGENSKEEAAEIIVEAPELENDQTEPLDFDLFAEDEPHKEETHTMDDDISDIIVDTEKLSQQIGVSEEDYTMFLNEYIDTALDLENALHSTDATVCADAVETLSRLSDVLQLGVLSDIVAAINPASAEKQAQSINAFYAALSRITTSKSTNEVTANQKVLELEVQEPAKELFDLTLDAEPETKKQTDKNGFGTISLEGIKPIHFDFRLEEAANDLSLPIDLIEEFVHDFIEQAHIETEKMLKAYEKGDLETIQKIGHLLKGASSNLRINALSDTLYKIQFCEDSKDLEPIIKDYWGHFLSFEIQINALAK